MGFGVVAIGGRTRTTRGVAYRTMLNCIALAGVTWMPVAFGHAGDGGDAALIHACAGKQDGHVRIVGASGACKPRELAMHWPAQSAPAAVVAPTLVFEHAWSKARVYFGLPAGEHVFRMQCATNSGQVIVGDPSMTNSWHVIEFP